MEKDDEVSGSGNSYTAEFWQYDARLGRRWNVDPVDKPWESSYATFSGNPIYYIDPNGDNADGYTIDGVGNLEKVDDTGGDKYDVVYQKEQYDNGNKNYDYEGTAGTGIRIDDKSFVPELQKKKPEAIQADAFSENKTIQGYYASINSNQALSVFKFLANATSGNNGIEWSYLKTTSGETTIGTLKSNSQGFMFNRLDKFSDLSTHAERIHSHPGVSWSALRVSGSDKRGAAMTRQHNPNAKFSVYMPKLTKVTYNEIAKKKAYSDVNGNIHPYPLLEKEPSKMVKY